MSEKILVIGANGQIGTELVTALRNEHGAEQVIASDINNPAYAIRNSGPFEFANVLDKETLHHLFQKHQPTQVYLLAAMLSATGEQKPKPPRFSGQVLLQFSDLIRLRKIHRSIA
jgi:nucleoside-diphosphate-sugar epimerase